MKYELSPSILSADFARLGEEIKAVEQTGVNYLHIDVMDGMFVPSISFGFPIIKSIRKMSNMVFDVHLMVEQPERYIEETAASGADIITIHAEACKHPDRAIEQIHQLGKKAGIALNPSTSLHELDYLLEKVDMVLLMTVNPGFGNQKYIPYCTGKVKELRTMIEERGLQTDIEVDGGINAATIDAVLEAGANILVAGSAVFGKETAKNAEKYRKLLNRKNIPRILVVFLLYLSQYIISTAMYGTAAYLLFDVPAAQMGLFLGTYLFSWIIGFITPGAPGGIGIREAVMVLMCGSFMSTETIMLYAVTMRIISTLGDVVAFLVGLICEQIWKRKATVQ